ncbi:hypothetical protein CSUI_002978 [Cystoisospora suis]|uniref:Uncharacterized protein n=1 Tax=Cystoisospora suis TaxID=483139 RepID=A0A2C6L6S1_9APIC|nr:hypothetical protein CSUI_002978 [Cystoisospora suis]
MLLPLYAEPRLLSYVLGWPKTWIGQLGLLDSTLSGTFSPLCSNDASEFFTQFPMIPRLGQNLLAYLGFLAPHRLPVVLWSPQCLLEETPTSGASRGALLAYLSVEFPLHWGGYSNSDLWPRVGQREVASVPSLSASYSPLVAYSAPSSVGHRNYSSSGSRHLFTCPWDFSDTRPGDQFLNWYHVKYWVHLPLVHSGAF